MTDPDDKKIDLLILGVHLKSESYPNVLFRIQDLLNHSGLEIQEINVPMWTESTQPQHGRKRLFRNPFQVVTSHLTVLYRYLRSGYRSSVYIPYPAILLQFLITLLPARSRPSNIVLDAFISLYDTIVIDRGLIRRELLPGKLIYRTEKRALAGADSIVVDTEQNRTYLAELFGISTGKIHAIPLSTDEITYAPTPYNPNNPICRVLFVGTLIPLHGIDVIVKAMNFLRNNREIEFHIIGTGQEAHILKAYQQTSPQNMKWTRTWKSSEELAEEIRKADICLGIFGVTGKTQRVCPYKIYAYSCVGRAIITAGTKWTDSLEDKSAEYFTLVQPGNAQELAERILSLKESTELRSIQAKNSHQFYQQHLKNQYAVKQLIRRIISAESDV
jgi:glycosyltransferase involved in cell wall biosynthesis